MAYSEKQLHIVSFDVPYPPSYGGVIDVFYKIQALAAQGVKIHLHCFQYGRPAASALEALCASVHYYPRNISKAALFRKLPYIVISRTSEALMERLLADQHPILFEGLHTCASLEDPRLKLRRKFVRTHNIEHEYYRNLAAVERNLFKRIYFYNEAGKLEPFEETLSHATAVAAISPNDTHHFSKINNRTFYLPAFHSNVKTDIPSGMGSFALYHGNLAVGENNKAALYLVQEVFQGTTIPFVVTGSKPSGELKAAIAKNSNMKLITDISTEEVTRLVHEAQVNVLPTFQPTGIKLKLLTALYNGRHAVVNREMVENTGLESLCHIADDAASMRSVTVSLLQQPLTENDIRHRQEILKNGFSNESGARQLIREIFD